MLLYVAALFFVLTPGVLVSLPPKAGKLTVAVTHAVVFAVVYELTHKFVWRALEGFVVNVMSNPSSMTSSTVSASARRASTPPPSSGQAVSTATPVSTTSGGMQMISFT